MSTRIRVSYEQEPELLDVVVLLGKRVQKVKREPAKGRYKRAYIDMKALPGEPAFTSCKTFTHCMAALVETSET